MLELKHIVDCESLCRFRRPIKPFNCAINYRVDNYLRQSDTINNSTRSRWPYFESLQMKEENHFPRGS